MAWSQILVQDALFILYKIKNDGTKPLNKVGVTICWADFVGGDGGDDISEFDLANDIIWSRDLDLRAPDFGSDPVGIVAGAFLETPGNSIDRIDNDGDSPEFGKKITLEMLVGESDESILPNDTRRYVWRYDGIDNNRNGLIDESLTHVAFQDQVGVTYADRIGQPINPAWLAQRPRFHRCENPVVTQEMVNQAATDPWRRWPANPENDPIQQGQVHLIGVVDADIGYPWKDNIDGCTLPGHTPEPGSPTITQSMIDVAAQDAPYYRYRLAGTRDKYGEEIILYNVVQSTLGMPYADGVDNNRDGAGDYGIDEGIDVMIDEARDNGIDDDYDWDPFSDDVGLDGVPGTGDEGEGDGKPTPGRDGLPGEPNIDVTDVAETDQI
ncbi:MAG: hypothetical protein WD295_01675, partial [Bacteroidota bacterium]